MKLDLDFNALTKLREWWKKIQSNFRIIETECTETRKIADNACTKEQAQAYVAEFAGSSGEYMEAIREFTALYNESGGTVSALEALYGKRLAYYEYAEELDADGTDETQNAVYVCNSGALNTPTGSGVLFNLTHNAGAGFQLWFAGDGSGIYRRSGGEWTFTDKDVRDRLDEAEGSLSGKSEIVFGVYTGDGAEERFINLGFTPVAVEVFERDGILDVNNGTISRGGLALEGNPCVYNDKNLLEVAENGFNAFYYNISNGLRGGTNSPYTKYYFKAYRYCEIMEV